MNFLQGVKSNIKTFDQVFFSLSDACQILYDNTIQSDEISNIKERGKNGKDLHHPRLLHSNPVKD
jgi:SET domain-containing protein